MIADSVRFDDATRPSLSDQPVPPGGFLRALRQTAEGAGLDPVAELYNEALRYASEGHLRMARERLHVLLGVSADDGEARLLLARVYVAGQRWADALSALDEAQSCGQHIDPALREAVESHLTADQESVEAHRDALRIREQGEVKALRSEARRLRAENAQLLGRCYETEREMRKWAWTTAAVSGLTIVFIAANLVLGPRSAPDDAEVVAAATEAVVPATGVVATEDANRATSDDGAAPAPASPPSNATVADASAAALAGAPGLDGSMLEVRVRAGSAVVSGEVLTHAQRALAAEVMQTVPGVVSADLSAVTVLARTEGTEHVVVSGDNLSKIAYRYYGEAALSRHILRANPNTLKGRSDLKIGQRLVVPAIVE